MRSPGSTPVSLPRAGGRGISYLERSARLVHLCHMLRVEWQLRLQCGGFVAESLSRRVCRAGGWAVRPVGSEHVQCIISEQVLRGMDGRQEVLPMTETARVLVLDTIRQQVHKFVMYNFLYDGVSADIDDDASLLEMGIIDATGILELTLFVEDIFGVRVPEADLVPENFDSVNNIARYIARNYVNS